MVSLSGFAHTRFTRKAKTTFLEMLRTAALESLQASGLDGKDIDHIVLSHFNHGLVRQGFSAGLSAEIDDSLRFKPAVRVENACASGSSAVHLAESLVMSGKANRVLVIGAEHMSQKPAAQIGEILKCAALCDEVDDGVQGFAGIFDVIAAGYHRRYADPREAMALIVSKNRANGTANPWAQLGGTPDGYQRADNPAVGEYLLKSDCSPISDGAAALVVSRDDDIPDKAARVRLRRTAQTNDFMSMARRDTTFFDGVAVMWKGLLASAGATNDSLDFAEIHDCFSIAELMLYEAMGIADRGRGAEAVRDGHVHRDGKLPVNPSGGLLAKGHPIGATGVSMHVMAGLQLTGLWDSGVKIRHGRAGIINMGGVAVANCGSILEAVQ